VSIPQPFKLRLPKEITVEEINVDRIDFNTAPPAQVDAVGRVYWDTTYNSLTVGLSANVQQKVGQALYKRARNDAGTQLEKGEVVYVSGSHALTELMIKRANANAEATSADTIGVVAETIANNATGFIQVFGYMTGLRTNIYSGAEGTPLYLDTSDGIMSSTLPTQPNHGLRVGFLVKKAGAGAGSIFINIQNYQELDELSDVLIGTKADNDFLTWDSTALVWKNTPLNTASPPASNGTGTVGSLRFGLSGGTYYLYYCYATNSWGRVALTTGY